MLLRIAKQRLSIKSPSIRSFSYMASFFSISPSADDNKSTDPAVNNSTNTMPASRNSIFDYFKHNKNRDSDKIDKGLYALIVSASLLIVNNQLNLSNKMGDHQLALTEKISTNQSNLSEKIVL